MASTTAVATLIEKEVEERLKLVVHSINNLVRLCEDPSIKNRTHLDWRAATLRDALQALEHPKRERKLSRDQRDIANDVARSLKEEMGWER